MSPALLRAAAFLLFLSFLLLSPTISAEHNITRLLAKHPEFSTFNHYLTTTHLAGEINRRKTITVLALNNDAMSSLLSKNLTAYVLKNVLSLHVIVDYFGARKLHQINGGSTLTSTMFQATGAAPGTTGYINITDYKGGKVMFGAEDNNGKLDAAFVKSVLEMPYEIAVMQISHPLNSAEAEAPMAAPSLNLTSIMTRQGCKAFTDLLIASGAVTTFEDNIESGLTVFCPPDKAVNGFMPKYKNLTKANQVSLLRYHGVPFYQSMQTLKSSNGLMNTLATDGDKKYDFTVQDDGEDVKLETKVITATILGTVKDEEPLVVYQIDKVLMPGELFKAEAAAAAPKASKADSEAADGPEADAPADDSADSTAANDVNGVSRMDGGRLMMVTLSLCLGMMLL